MLKIHSIWAGILAVFFLACTLPADSTQTLKASLSNDMNQPMQEGLEIATLGAGCFWCVEAVYQDLEGVHKVVSGIYGGKDQNLPIRKYAAVLRAMQRWLRFTLILR